MTGFNFGDVILVSFPFTNQVGTKKRPAVVINSDVYHAQRRDILIVPITSQVKPIPILGEAQLSEWSEAGLLKPSMIKAVIATMDETLVIKKMGTLGVADRQSLLHMLHTILTLT